MNFGVMLADAFGEED